MARRVFYEFDKDANFEEITSRVRLYSVDVTQNAEEGSVALSQISVDDPDGDYDIVGWRVMRISEDAAAASNTVVYYGWVADKTISRKVFRTGPGRVWDVSLADQNTVIEMRVLNGSDANRPAETDVERLQWLLSTNEMSRVTVSEFFNTASPKAMDAVDYRGQRVRDVIDDCAQQSGKNYFIYIKDTTTSVSTSKLGIATAFYYDFDTGTNHSSIVRLTNNLSDVDGDLTFAISDDTQLVRDPGRTYSGAYVRYDGGTVYEENFTISNQFTRRDAVYDAQNVKSSAKATARALRYLTTTDTEEDRIRTAFYAPAAKVAYVRAGMRVQFRATHLPGYETWSWLRVLKCQVLEVSEDPAFGYLVTLELSANPHSFSPSGPPDIVLQACNDISIGQRDGSDFGPTLNAGQVYYYEAINDQHEDNAFTDGFALSIGAQQIDFVALAGGNVNGVLQGTPGSGLYPDPFPTQTGTFTVTTGGTTILDVSTDGYVIGGPTFIDDCWTVNLYLVP